MAKQQRPGHKDSHRQGSHKEQPSEGPFPEGPLEVLSPLKTPTSQSNISNPAPKQLSCHFGKMHFEKDCANYSTPLPVEGRSNSKA